MSETNGYGMTPAGGPLLLVAEDNPANQKVAVAMLAKLGYTADVVANGEEAVAASSRTGYAAVLMDCQMPVMDGYAAASSIRRLEGESARTPIIAMTASVTGDIKQRCLAAGMDDYLSKPVMLDQLAAALRRWIPDVPTSSEGVGTNHVWAATDPFDPERVADLRTLNTPGKPDLFFHLATPFADDAARRFRALVQALEGGDTGQAAREAHGLYGGAATLGAMRLADLCRQFEEQLSAGDWRDSKIPALIAAEISHIKQFLDRPR